MPSPGEAGLLVAIAFGWFIMSSVFAVMNGFRVDSNGFSDSGLLGLIAVEVVFGAIALAFLHSRGYQLRELMPSPNWSGCLWGVLVFAAAAIACSVIARFFTPDELAVQPLGQMVANAHPSLQVVLALAALNGVYEETFLLGYLVRGFQEAGASFALGLSTLVRLLCHLYQGPVGALSVAVFGLVLSAVYWRTRQLWPAVVAHALADVVAFL
jgi:membrane protease YdiL (CAAX protease family)